MEKNYDGMLQEVFGRNLKERRKRMGITQGELAQRIGVSTSFVTEIEKGRKAGLYIYHQPASDSRRAVRCFGKMAEACQDDLLHSRF